MIRLNDLEFSYGEDFCLRIEQLDVKAKEHVAIIGPSGSGKTTLLHVLAGILMPTRGSVEICDQNLRGMSEAARRNFRAANIGLVFQEFELIEYLNMLDNILLTYRVNNSLHLTRDVRLRGEELASNVGIGQKLSKFPDQLSHGEKQRVAICRAVLAGPRLILADEPTGNLDPANKDRVIDILLRAAKENGSTMLMVTHDHTLLERFDRVVDLATLNVHGPLFSRDAAGSACGANGLSRSPLGRG